LSGVVWTPQTAPGAKHVFHQYTIATDRRDEVEQALAAAEIGYGVYYPEGTHLQAPYRDGDHAHLPVTDRVTKQVLSIPTRPDLEESELEFVIETAAGVFR
jgi:perosamine synthetase